MLTTKPTITTTIESLFYSVQSNSVDQVIKDLELNTEVQEFLTTSSLGLEYITINVSHGDQIYITVHR